MIVIGKSSLIKPDIKQKKEQAVFQEYYFHEYYNFQILAKNYFSSSYKKSIIITG